MDPLTALLQRLWLDVRSPGPPPTTEYYPPTWSPGASPPATPMVSGGVTLPFLGDELQLRGRYLHDPVAPSYGINFGFSRRF